MDSCIIKHFYWRVIISTDSTRISEAPEGWHLRCPLVAGCSTLWHHKHSVQQAWINVTLPIGISKSLDRSLFCSSSVLPKPREGKKHAYLQKKIFGVFSQRLRQIPHWSLANLWHPLFKILIFSMYCLPGKTKHTLGEPGWTPFCLHNCLHFSWHTFKELTRVFYYCRLHVLCLQRPESPADLGCQGWLFELLLPSYHLEPVGPICSDISHQQDRDIFSSSDHSL